MIAMLHFLVLAAVAISAQGCVAKCQEMRNANVVPSTFSPSIHDAGVLKVTI